MKPKILFIGGTTRGLKLLEFLTSHGQSIVSAVILQEDPHELIQASPQLQNVCRQKKIPFRLSRRLTPLDVEEILKQKPDVCFVCGWRTLLPENLYDGLPLGCLAAHDSLLPKYRGFAPTAWAIIHGEKTIGVTLFKISAGPVDSGPIFGQKKISVLGHQTTADLYPSLVEASVELFGKFLRAVSKKTVRWTRQNEAQATYCCRRTPSDGKIDWNQKAESIFNLTRALTPPNPWAWTTIEGRKLFIIKAAPSAKPVCFAGRIIGRISRIDQTGVGVLCSDGEMILKELMDEEGQRYPACELIRSLTVTLGE